MYYFTKIFITLQNILKNNIKIINLLQMNALIVHFQNEPYLGEWIRYSCLHPIIL